jgi:prepilin-type N-terminal cleavage/methylation domain-containing protein
MTHLTARIRRHPAGFSMIEVALALLILSIGVLTMVGLMSGGLDMSKVAGDYTQSSVFASDTMEGVRNFAANGSPTNGLTKFWSTLQTGPGLMLTGVVASVFDSYTQQQVPIQTVQKFGGIGYTNFSYTYSNSVDSAFRYRMSVEQFPGLTGNLLDEVASVKLDVVNGLFGAAATQSFYTEVFQFVR